MAIYDDEQRFKDALDYEKIASGHDDRAGLNDSLARANSLPEAERTLHGELATMHGALAARYRTLARAIRERPLSRSSGDA